MHESLLFSARLRFTKDVSRDIVNAFVEEVMLPGLQTLSPKPYKSYPTCTLNSLATSWCL